MNGLQQQIGSIKHWIDTNDRYDLMIDDVVKKSGWSKWHLQRVFTKEVGCSIGRYVSERRMVKAKGLILAGEQPIDVCAMSGFESLSSFYRAFRKRYGCTPKQMANGVE
ncbi:MAG: helix-turn-helix transcriptional regulator [Mesorhizobium sp.]|nr:MAG: helix-turn-helix transcriptional regulator [Mesorhizobium sp.]